MMVSGKNDLILEKKITLFPALNLWNQQVVPVAYLSRSSSEGDLPILSTEEDLRQFLCGNEVNQIRVPASAIETYQNFEEKLLVSGIPILMEDENGRVFKRLNVFKINRPHNRFLRRTLDIVGASVGCIIYAGVVRYVKPKIESESPGEIIFKQERVGRRGRRFMMKKFRSMNLDAEERKSELLVQNEVSSQHMFKIENDPRVFPFGQKMRDSSIDEVPQFFNVLKGEMSLIGTRPPTTDEYNHYDFHHFKRSAIKPGITGLWQVSGRSDIKDFEDVVALDVEYIETWSIFKDINILAKTLVVVFKKVGAR